MRTTVTLDPDVEALLRNKAHASRTSFKKVLNNAVRRALGPEGGGERMPPFRVHPRPLGMKPAYQGVSMNHLAAELEDAALTQKVEARNRSS